METKNTSSLIVIFALLKSKRLFFWPFFGLALILALFMNCSSKHDTANVGPDPGPDATVQILDFQLHDSAMKLLSAHCSKCHGPNGRESDKFGSVEDIELMVRQGYIRPGLPEISSIFVKVRDGDMPREATPLSKAAVDLLNNWISKGLKLKPSASDGSVVTYYGDVRPILNKNCVSCHSSEAASFGPFALDTYELAAAQAIQIKEETSERRMPPYLVDTLGSCQTYTGKQWLSEAEIKTLAEWADGGAISGVEISPISPPLSSSLIDVDVTLAMESSYVPNPATGQEEDFRCFILDAPNKDENQSSYLVGYEVLPGNLKVVHHLVFGFLPLDADLIKAEQLDAADPEAGYSCYGDTLTGFSLLGAWVPGSGAVVLPSGIGIEVPVNRKIVMQIHYNTADGNGPDLTRLKFDMENSVAKPATFRLEGRAGGFTIPAGQSSYTFEYEPSSAIGANIALHAVFPHMHEYGTKIRLEILRENSSSLCAMDVPRWDFEWQNIYFYTEPLIINKNDRFRISCTYDTSSSNSPIKFGGNTSDEMCIVGVLITAP